MIDNPAMRYSACEQIRNVSGLCEIASRYIDAEIAQASLSEEENDTLSNCETMLNHVYEMLNTLSESIRRSLPRGGE